MDKRISVERPCKISEFYSEDNEYVLDIIADEEDWGNFVNFQFSVELSQCCCESNDIDTIDFDFEEVEERFVSRWGIEEKKLVHVTRQFVNYIEFETEDEGNDYECGGSIKVVISLKNGQQLKAEYSNYHNGYYAHCVTVEEDGSVIYEGIY